MPTNVGILTFISRINTSKKNLYMSACSVLLAIAISCSVEYEKVVKPGGLISHGNVNIMRLYRLFFYNMNKI